MDIRELKYFIAVAECGSISKAAENLFVTQPNLSRAIKKLEDEIGQTLVIRGNKRTVLTDVGQSLYKRAKEIAELMDKTQAELLTDGSDVCGTVSIGSGESYAVGIIARAAHNVSSVYPRIRFDFFSGDTDAVTEKLDKGLIDFGILIEPSDLEKYNSMRLPLTDSWGILMKKDCPLAEKSYVTRKDLEDLPLIFSVHSLKKNPITAWFGKNPDELNVVATYNLLFNASLIIEEGIGYAVGLDRIINVSGDSTLAFRRFYPPLETHLDVAWKKGSGLSDAARIFLGELKSLLKTEQM